MSIHVRAITLTVPDEGRVRKQMTITEIVQRADTLDEEVRKTFICTDSVYDVMEIDSSSLELALEDTSLEETTLEMGGYFSDSRGRTWLVFVHYASPEPWVDNLTPNIHELAAGNRSFIVVPPNYGQRCEALLVVPTGDDAVKPQGIMVTQNDMSKVLTQVL